MADDTGCMGALRPGYTTGEGFCRYSVGTWLDGYLYHQLEDYRKKRQLTRSDAIRRMIRAHLNTNTDI